MARMLRIARCIECPLMLVQEGEYNCGWGVNFQNEYDVIPDEVCENGTPDWCPLPVAEEEVNDAV